MKTVVLISSLLFCGAVDSTPYIEAKSKAKVTSDSYAVSYFTNEAVNHIRLGNAWDNAYIEAGKMTNGVSSEAGYRFRKIGGSNFTLKGKVESTKRDGEQWVHGVETELRYTFD